VTTDAQIVEVDGAGFTAAMAPTVEVIRSVTDAIKGASERHSNLPGVNSVAMQDLAAQENGKIVKPKDWDVPIGDAQTLGSVDLLAATDAARCYGELFSGTRAPLYGHLTLARACLEACVVSAWLSDPKISPTERQRRTLVELIYSAKEVKRLGMEEPDVADERIALWLGVAAELGWEVSKDTKPQVNGSGRPAMAAAIDQLLIDKGRPRLGRVQWSYLSGVNHTVWFALRQAFVGDVTADAMGPSTAPLGTESKPVYTQTLCLLRALRVAATTRMIYMGWVDDEWEYAANVGLTHEVELFRRVTAASSTS
jgi:hypothetical protein